MRVLDLFAGLGGWWHRRRCLLCNGGLAQLEAIASRLRRYPDPRWP